MLSGNHVIYHFSADAPPATVIPSGSRMEVETLDCFSGQLLSGGKSLEQLDTAQMNPATGPIYIEGAMPGDDLRVTIEQIRLGTEGIVVCGPGDGLLGAWVREKHMRRMRVERGFIRWNEQIRIPVRPMIGVIGTAPAVGAVPTDTPGAHGGNLDNRMIAAGAEVFLPVAVPGALLALGDVHAVMGDGEIGISGLEIPAVVTIRVEVIPNWQAKGPMLENPQVLSTIASAKTADAAVQAAAEEMLRLLMERTGEPAEQLVMLMSLVGNAEICQLVNPLKTARFTMPKNVLLFD